MEQLIAEFKAKSLFIPSLGLGMFFSWDLLATSKEHEVVIDANALADPTRNIDEVVKLSYLCFKKYESTARKLGLDAPSTPSFEVVGVWFSTMPEEAVVAIKYITEQLYKKSDDDIKKKLPPKSEESKNENSESPTQSSKIMRRCQNFFRGSASRGTLKKH